MTAMRHDDFTRLWLEALRESGLRVAAVDELAESLDLRSMTRTGSSSVETAQDAAPFHVVAALSWKWHALQTARTVTTEEDLLTTLLDRASDKVRTQRPWLRVDVELHATLPWGHDLPMPGPQVWARWAREAIGRLEVIEPLVPAETTRAGRGGRLEYLAWQGAPDIDVACAADGSLQLRGVRVSSWQAIELARIWDNTDRKPDRGTAAQLVAVLRWGPRYHQGAPMRGYVAVPIPGGTSLHGDLRAERDSVDVGWADPLHGHLWWPPCGRTAAGLRLVVAERRHPGPSCFRCKLLE